MTPRIDYQKSAGISAMAGLERYVRQCGLERSLLELIKLRASQINGCAYCVDMHTKDARARGESEQRLYAVSVWREAPFFTERERIALEWTESLTLISERGIPDALYEKARTHFNEKELVDLTFAVITINGWNRLAIGFRSEVGSYQPAEKERA
jgi:AhpD family alkylhydroperoxidase